MIPGYRMHEMAGCLLFVGLALGAWALFLLVAAVVQSLAHIILRGVA